MPENPASASFSSESLRRGPVAHLFLAFLVLLLVSAGAFSLWFAFSVQHTLGGRVLSLGTAGMMFFLPVHFAFVSTRRRLRHGHWLPRQDEVVAHYRKDHTRAQSPPVRRVALGFKIFLCLITVVLWAATDRIILRRHGFHSWWTLYYGFLQLTALVTCWSAIRSSPKKSALPPPEA
jgi:hypothetical protein